MCYLLECISVLGATICFAAWLVLANKYRIFYIVRTCRRIAPPSTGPFDRDQDGILDWWEVFHASGGLSPTNAADALLDPDGDGLINLHEYWAGCDPNIPDGSNTVLSIAARSIDSRISGLNPDATREKFLNYTNDVYLGTRARFVNTDIRISLLNTELPTNDVTPAILLPINYRNFIKSATGLPKVALDKYEQAVIHDIYAITEHNSIVNYVTTRPPRNNLRAAFNNVAETGDSGSPNFLVIDNQLVLLNVAWTKPGFNGTILTDYADEIESTINILSPSENYRLKFFDFSPYNILLEDRP